MSTSRRTFLRASLAGSTLAVAMGAGLLSPRTVLAAWPQKAFATDSLEEAMKGIVGGSNATPSDKVVVEAPDIAENGAVVSITVKSSIPNAESIAVFVPENTAPLTMSYLVTAQITDFITSRIKMRKTSEVLAVVKASGKLYSGKKSVKVTLGGCGG